MAEYIGKKKWPAWRYTSDGEGGFKGAIFQKEEDVPEGWVDSPAEAKKPKHVPELVAEPSPKPKRKPRAKKTTAKRSEGDAALDAARSEALRTLREAGVDIGSDATDDDISEALEALE